MLQLRLLDDHKEVSSQHSWKDVSQQYAYGELIPPTISRILRVASSANDLAMSRASVSAVS